MHIHIATYYRDRPASLLRMCRQPLMFINKVGGSRRGLFIRHIQLSGLPLEPRCLDNRIIEVPRTVLALIPGRSSSKRGPGIDCLRMR